MARIRRAKLERGFVALSNELAQAQQLTFRARGLLLYLMSLPDNFSLNVSALIKRSLEGKHVIYQTLEELKQAGLLDRVQIRGNNGKISSWDYLIYDSLQPEIIKKYGSKSPLPKNQEVVQGSLNSPLPENQEVAENRSKTDPLPDFLDPENLDPENQPLNNKYSKNKYCKKTAAAIENSVESSGEAPSSTPAAAAGLKKMPEEYIGDALTATQQRQVDQVITALHSQCH